MKKTMKTIKDSTIEEILSDIHTEGGQIKEAITRELKLIKTNPSYVSKIKPNELKQRLMYLQSQTKRLIQTRNENLSYISLN